MEEDYVPLSERPEWSDIQPTPEFTPAPPVAPIAYSEKCKIYLVQEIMGYFRTITSLNERSQRAFDLTTEVISVTPGFYTAWHYRKGLVDELNIDLQQEMDYLNRLGPMLPKNYQLWYYRREIMDRLNDPTDELEYLEGILEPDQKNVHVWGYRQWVVKRFNLWEEELKFVEELIESDPRNNSAWNQRRYVLENMGGYNSRDRVEKEIE